MTTINEKSTISITYEGILDNGEVFSTITEDAPLTITVGNSDLPPTLEQELIGMAVGESKKIRVPPEEGFGPRQKILLQTIERKTFPSDITPKAGMIVSLKVMKEGEEHKVPATIVKVSDKSVEVDYNHPLAGHHLSYNIKIVKIENK